MGCSFTNTGRYGAIAILRAINDDGFSEAILVAKCIFEIGKGANWRNHCRTHDVFLLGTFQHSGNGCLRHMHNFSNLRLPFALYVIHLGNSGDQSQLIEPCHANLRQ
ncbi:hypothetical protein D3C80_1780430 [compost metagenome]